ncbi:MAG: GNAT family N-acetyltransferase [Pyrinomonadaceae bacterium]
MNGFLKQYAFKNDRNDIGRTFVAVELGKLKVVGYYTISAGSVRFDSFPAGLKLPRYPIGTVHIGRLATDQSVQGQGLGEALLFDALQRSERAATQLGIKAVELYAINDKARSFYLQYGFQPLADDKYHLYMSMDAIRQACPRHLHDVKMLF